MKRDIRKILEQARQQTRIAVTTASAVLGREVTTPSVPEAPLPDYSRDVRDSEAFQCFERAYYKAQGKMARNAGPGAKPTKK
jgi:hypothetical protein